MILALALSLALPVQAKPQEPAPFKPKFPLTFATEARMVNLTVTARGVDGKLVKNLTSEDFTIYEDDNETYAYERGERATYELKWDDANRTLRIGARQGSFPGMIASRESPSIGD